MTIIICCCNNAVNAVVPPELYANFGIASSSLADTFTATSNVILDDTNVRLNEQSIKFDLLWSAIGRACPPNVFSNDPVNMKLLEKYVRTSGCLATTFFDSHEKYFSHNNNIIPENQKDGVIKIVFYNNNNNNGNQPKINHNNNNNNNEETYFNLFDKTLSLPYDVLYYVLIGNIHGLNIHGGDWTIRSKFLVDKRTTHGLKYFVFEDISDLKREIVIPLFRHDPGQTEYYEHKGYINYQNESDYKYTLHKVCEKINNVDKCEWSDVEKVFSNDLTIFNKLFLATQYYRKAILTKRQKCESILSKNYFEMIQVDGDIQEHITMLRTLGGSVNHITEFGIRSGVSTLSWFLGGANTVVGYDLKLLPSLNKIINLTKTCNRQLILNEGDTAKVTIDPTDLLFIDSLHTGEHLRKELFRHHLKVNKYIVLHDTESCGNAIPNNDYAWNIFCLGGANLNHTEGLRPVVDEFLMKANGDWIINFEKFNNNGLMMLERIGNTSVFGYGDLKKK